jgi:hypothetical protein
MRIALLCVAGLICAAGCRGGYEAIVPEVTQARITVDGAKPVGMASIDVGLLLHGHAGTDAVAELIWAGLRDESGATAMEVAELRLGFPAGFDAHVIDDQCLSAALQNIGTTNGELKPLCGRALDLRLMFEAGDSFAANRPTIVTVDCP